MKELFSEFGKLTKVNLHHDKNGKPQGSCDINFARKPDAVKAVKRYNKVPLDGRPMEIRIVEDLAKVEKARQMAKARMPLSQRISKRPNQSNNNNGRQVRQVRPVGKLPARNAKAIKQVAARNNRQTNQGGNNKTSMRQKMMMKVRKSASRANKVKNTQKNKLVVVWMKIFFRGFIFESVASVKIYQRL